MELGSQIRRRRSALGLSQDELARRIYVSRQTISSWENDKTYPDVQSLLLLSNVFGTTVDSLIKGDVVDMEKKVGAEGKRLERLGFAMLGLTLALLAVTGWGCWQHFKGWGTHLAPTVVLALLLLVTLIVVAERAEQLKREHDLMTYREILAFTHGEPVDRTVEQSRRLRESPAARAKDRLICVAVSLLIGGAAGYAIAWLADMLS